MKNNSCTDVSMNRFLCIMVLIIRFHPKHDIEMLNHFNGKNDVEHIRLLCRCSICRLSNTVFMCCTNQCLSSCFIQHQEEIFCSTLNDCSLHEHCI